MLFPLPVARPASECNLLKTIHVLVCAARDAYQDNKIMISQVILNGKGCTYLFRCVFAHKEAPSPLCRLRGLVCRFIGPFVAAQGSCGGVGFYVSMSLFGCLLNLTTPYSTFERSKRASTGQKTLRSACQLLDNVNGQEFFFVCRHLLFSRSIAHIQTYIYTRACTLFRLRVMQLV